MGMQVGTTSENGGVSLTTLWANRVDSTSSIAWWCFLEGLSLRDLRSPRYRMTAALTPRATKEVAAFQGSLKRVNPWGSALAISWRLSWALRHRMEGSQYAKPQFVAILGRSVSDAPFFGIPRVPSNTLFELHTFQVLMLMKHVFFVPGLSQGLGSGSEMRIYDISWR